VGGVHLEAQVREMRIARQWQGRVGVPDHVGGGGLGDVCRDGDHLHVAGVVRHHQVRDDLRGPGREVVVPEAGELHRLPDGGTAMHGPGLRGAEARGDGDGNDLPVGHGATVADDGLLGQRIPRFVALGR